MCSADYYTFATLLILEEWGDKSQFSAIALAANYGAWAIIIGGTIAHLLCVCLALAIGELLNKFMKPWVIKLIGGLLFIAFGLYELVFNLIIPYS